MQKPQQGPAQDSGYIKHIHSYYMHIVTVQQELGLGSWLALSRPSWPLQGPIVIL